MATNVCRSSNACVQIRDWLSFEFYKLLVWKGGEGGEGGRGDGSERTSVEPALFYSITSNTHLVRHVILSGCVVCIVLAAKSVARIEGTRCFEITM